MIDFHTHILPNMDDGSDSVETSLQMLEEASKQGFDTVIASSHFYPNVEDIDSFIKRRDKAYSLLEDKDLNIRVLKGAEVQFFNGISKNEDVRNLCIEGTNVLLVEMPFNRKFDKSMIDELVELTRFYKVMIAHFERYLENNSIDLFKSLYKNGVVIQVNAGSFNRYFLRRKLIKMIKLGFKVIIASDMHNMTTRPENVFQALERIKKSVDVSTYNQLLKYNENIIG